MNIDRSRFIGGSDIAAILGISPWKTAVDLWLEKTAPVVQDDDPERAKVLTRGKRLEPYVLDMLTREQGFGITARGERYTDPDTSYFAAEIDAECTPYPSMIVNLEIKTVHPFKVKEWGEELTDELPLHYLAQVHWGLGVTRRARAIVAALIGDDLKLYNVERDDETIEAMRAKAHAFWTDHVIPRVRPPLDYADARTIDTLRALYPGTNGKALHAGDALEHWRVVHDEAIDRAARYTAAAEAAKAHLLDAMGEAALLTFNDGRALRRKHVTRKGYVVAETTYIEARFVKAPNITTNEPKAIEA
jgi:putative phage-type endonuclease